MSESVCFDPLDILHNHIFISTFVQQISHNDDFAISFSQNNMFVQGLAKNSEFVHALAQNPEIHSYIKNTVEKELDASFDSRLITSELRLVKRVAQLEVITGV